MVSLGSIFRQWFRPAEAVVLRGATQVATSHSRRDPAHPPADPAMPAVPARDVIAPHVELLKRLRDAYGAEEQVFERDIVSVVTHYARFVHLLPATGDGYFRSAGGLFRMGLEVGFYALQATDGAIFSGRQTITQRSALEPRWRYATFLAGLLSELHCALNRFIVTSERGREWPAYVTPLAVWLREERANRYYLRWRARPPEAQALAILAMARIVGRGILRYLAEGNTSVVPSLVAAVSATASREVTMLEELVRRASALVIERDLADNPDRHGAVLGLHLERHLVDAMRRLVAEGKWIANAPASRLWYAEDGMFLLWPEAAADMIALLELDRLPGVPKSQQTIAELLAQAWVIEARPDGALSWDIFPPNASTASAAVKLVSPALLASAASTAPKPLPRRLRERAAPENPAPAPTQTEFTLSITGRESIETSTEAQSTEIEGPRSQIALNAPARLNPAVRDALRQILATMDSPAQPLAAFVLKLGVFIPLKEFEQRSVDPALAVRALSEAGMLATDPKRPGSKTHSRNFHDEPVLGVVVDFRHVCGLHVGARAQAPHEPDAAQP